MKETSAETSINAPLKIQDVQDVMTRIKTHERNLCTSDAPIDLWYNDPQANETIRRAVALGWLHRMSVTQVQWTEAGVNEAHKAEPIRTMKCSCCGGYTKGRQWWNRDTGFGGPCVSCISHFQKRGYTPEEMRRSYGTRGIHYDLDTTNLND